MSNSKEPGEKLSGNSVTSLGRQIDRRAGRANETHRHRVSEKIERVRERERSTFAFRC